MVNISMKDISFSARSFSVFDPLQVNAWFKASFTKPFRTAVQSRFMLVDFCNGRFAYLYSQKRIRKDAPRVFACEYAVCERSCALHRVEPDDLFDLFGIDPRIAALFDRGKPYYKGGRPIQGAPLAELVCSFKKIAEKRPFPGQLDCCHVPLIEALPYRLLPWVPSKGRVFTYDRAF